MHPIKLPLASLLLLAACQATPPLSQPAASPSASVSSTPGPDQTPEPEQSPQPTPVPTPMPTPLPEPMSSLTPTPYPTPVAIPSGPMPSVWPTNIQPQGPVPTPRPKPYPPLDNCSRSWQIKYELAESPRWSADGQWLSWESQAGTDSYSGGAFCGERGKGYFSQIKVWSAADGQTRSVLGSEQLQNAFVIGWNPQQPQLLYGAPLQNGGYNYLHAYQAASAKSALLSSNSPFVRRAAAWSANGQQIAFYRARTTEHELSAIALLKTDSSAIQLLKELPLNQYVDDLDWWPDQTSLLLVLRDQPAFSLQRLMPDGGLQQIWQPESRPEPQEILSQSFSPDGRQLAWVVQRLALNSNQSGVYPQQLLYLAEVSAEGLSSIRQISGLNRVGQDFSWSPDSRYLVLSEGTSQLQEPDTEDLYRLDSQSDSLLRLTRDGEGVNPIRNRMPAWSPDNQWIAFSSNSQTQFDKWYAQPTDLFLVKPDGSELKQLTQTLYSEKQL